MLEGVETGYEEKFDFPERSAPPALIYTLASVPRTGSVRQPSLMAIGMPRRASRLSEFPAWQPFRILTQFAGAAAKAMAQSLPAANVAERRVRREMLFAAAARSPAAEPFPAPRSPPDTASVREGCEGRQTQAARQSGPRGFLRAGRDVRRLA